MAKLYFIYGCMGCSKSAQLLMKSHSFDERNIPHICIKPTIDDRDGVDIIKSRIGLKKECLSIDIDDNIYELITKFRAQSIFEGVETPKWLLVDESQFLSEEQVDNLAQIVDEFDINVMCYGLRSDFTTKMFKGSQRLMEIADNIEEMKISCSCGNKAIVNARFNNGEIVLDGEQIMIGGDEMYIPLCRKCYNNLKNKCKNY